MIKYSNLSAIILAGGKSSRMGADKGLVSFQGQEMIARAITLLQPHFKDVFIIANDAAYMKFGLPVYEDLYTDKGPLAGIYAGLNYSKTSWNFFMACDMPFVTFDIIQKLAENLDASNAVVPSHHKMNEPLCAFYNQSCTPLIEQRLKNGNLKLHDLLTSMDVKFVDFNSQLISEAKPFRNINTLNELQIATKS